MFQKRMSIFAKTTKIQATMLIMIGDHLMEVAIEFISMADWRKRMLEETQLGAESF